MTNAMTPTFRNGLSWGPLMMPPVFNVFLARMYGMRARCRTRDCAALMGLQFPAALLAAPIGD